MKSDTTNSTDNTNIINMLSLWLTPDMWQDKTLYAEVEVAIKKFSKSIYQLSERELFLTQELTHGLLEATLVSFDKANNPLKEELSLSIKDILEFQFLFVTDAETH